MRFKPAILILIVCLCSHVNVMAEELVTKRSRESITLLMKNYCIDCHDSDDAEAGLNLDRFDVSIAGSDHAWDTTQWERIVKRLRSRQMPPVDADRPDEKEYQQTLTAMESILSGSASQHPRPGRTDSFRRLNRTEYKNAIRDLLALDVDTDTLLPPDESSHGFDNVTVADLPPTLLTRYINAAQKISRLAIGTTNGQPTGHTYRIPADVTQENHVPGLPLGTRGGTLIKHTFPQQGEYEIHVLLARDRNEHIEGLSAKHELEFLLDRKRVADFTVKPGQKSQSYDNQFKQRIHVPAGPHDLGITFVKNGSSLQETKRQPLNVHFNFHRHPRLSPAIYQISITGPYDSEKEETPVTEQPAINTPSRTRIFTMYPEQPEEEAAYAKQIISTLARRAYRRPVTEADLARPLAFYHQAHAKQGFEAGIEMALSAILVSPNFLFRIEREPKQIESGKAYTINDFELASRLSFFLWSSIPDEELLQAAEQGTLHDPEVLKQQVIRMLGDPRSSSLVTNFASQWLYLRNLDSKTPDARIFPDFDHNLRQAFRTETELFFQSILREDRSVLDLISADYTYLNERLAKHYGIPHIYGSQFRRVNLPADSHRGGLLRNGSILTVTSYATRTSPVIRGNWVLRNILGTSVPPPPDDVPSLEEQKVLGAELSVRERLAQHRANPACASCHNLMDPVGFALENFDAVGRWREMEAGQAVDVSGGLPDGSQFSGIEGLEQGILDRPEMFVGTMSEKLMTYALGRGLESYDGPAIRQVIKSAAAEDYRFSAIIWGIVNSTPFQMRTSQ
ncbi:MAG: hypothetical protein COA78_11460 [Blastopirellula sp.]|nr:MAG: hypothetical protein COA78_11460 [Blastopirellula sp.]